MSTASALIEELKEHLAPLGQISARRMFGGAGVYCDGLIFAILVDDELYLKTGDVNRPDFVAEGLPPFSYEAKQGRTVVTSYYRAPERIFDDPDDLRAWVTAALVSARTAAAGKAKAPRKPSAKRGNR